MKILDKYIVKGFVSSLFYCLTVFYLLFIIADMLGHMDEILKNRVPLEILARFYISFSPLIFVQTTPLAGLLATVYVLSAMNKNNELTAMKASGINIFATMRPIFVIGIIICLGIFYVNENIAPKGALVSEKIKTEYIESNKKDKELKSVKNLTVYGKASQMIYAKGFNPATNRLDEVIILEHDKDQKLKRKILARYGVWFNEKWTFYDVIVYRFDEFGHPRGQVLTFNKKVVRLPDKPSDLLKGEGAATYMNYSQLKIYINRVKGADKKTIDRLRTDLYFKLALPFCVFIMILLGIPFSLTTVRGGVAASMGISIIAGLLYYGFIGVCLSLGKGNFLPPLIAVHLPNVVFFTIAVMLIKKAPA
ncbi:MAG: LptF/LptG family permease [Candidatus Omnitrophota bacterium]